MRWSFIFFKTIAVMENIESTAEAGVYEFLDSIGMPYEVTHHAPAFTMDECMAVERTLGVPVCKNLFLCNRQQTEFYLLMIPSDKPFKTRFLSSQIGCARLSFASEENMERLLRIAPGAVSPMGLIYDKGHTVRLLIDSELEGIDRFGCHPCVNTATLALPMREFLTVYLPAVGHEPAFVSLPRPEEMS